MQSIIVGLEKNCGKELNIINNILDKGYNKYKKDDIPIVITLGDDDTPLQSRMVNIEPDSRSNLETSDNNEAQEILNISKRFGDLNTNEKLGSNQFTVSDTFLYLKDIAALIDLFDANLENADLFAESFCYIPNISSYSHQSIKLYKSVLINYSDKNKKLLAVILSRALGYVIAKDLALGEYALGEDDNVTDIDPIVCRTALMTIAAYYSWQIMEDSGLSYKVRHNQDLERSAKMAMQTYIFGGLEFESKENEEQSLVRHLYILVNYITLNYVINESKMNIRSLFAKGSGDYERAIGALIASFDQRATIPRDVVEGIYDEKLKTALPALEHLVDYCIELVEKCKVNKALTNDDLKPMEKAIDATRHQLTKELDLGCVTDIVKAKQEKSLAERSSKLMDAVSQLSKKDDMKQFLKSQVMH